MTILYTAPTAIRAFIRAGDEWPKKHDLSSLRLLGTVGEPINPEAWIWYHRVIGGGRCPIVDTWWQTETGAIMMTTLPGRRRSKPGSTGLRSSASSRRGRRQRRQRVKTERRRQALVLAPVALDAAHALGRRRALPEARTGATSRTSTSPATARGATKTATSGSSVASTTCSTSPAIASAPPRSRARWSRTRSSPRPPRSGAPTTSRGRRWSCSSR